MAQARDPALEARIDGYIDRVGGAADRDPDGYLNTYTQMRRTRPPLGPAWRKRPLAARPLQRRLYGRCRYSLLCATGKTKLLATAVRAANLMVPVVGPPPRKNIIPGHALSEESFFRLYNCSKSIRISKQNWMCGSRRRAISISVSSGSMPRAP